LAQAIARHTGTEHRRARTRQTHGSGRDRSSCELAGAPIEKSAIVPPAVIEISRPSRGTAIALSHRHETMYRRRPATGGWQMSEERFDRIDQALAHLGAGLENVNHNMHVLHEDALSRIAAVAESVVVLDQKMERGFAEVRTDMDHGFAEVRADMDHRFAEVRADMDHRFAEVKTNMDSQSAELRRHMGVLYEQTVESIAITRDPTPHIDAKIDQAVIELTEKIGRRLDPLETAVRQHSAAIRRHDAEVAALKGRRK
jgi:deoxyribodipyrimidine photolyase